MKLTLTLESDRAINGGKLCIEGTSIPISLLQAYLMDADIEQFFKAYPWTRDKVIIEVKPKRKSK